MSGPFGSSVFSYNGLGDRLTQNGVNYTLDLNSGLTQVLNDGTNTYVYGLGRIAEYQGSVGEYYLGDALGSVRQLVDDGGEITLAKTYEPYGDLAQATGTAQTDYGFTGELTDPSGMVYLRARYYAPEQGRFITRDTWMGDYNNPLSLNRWGYVEGNPINYIDPTGYIKETEAKKAFERMELLRNFYDVRIVVDWGYVDSNTGMLIGLLPIDPDLLLQYGYGCAKWVEGEWTMEELDKVLYGVDVLATSMGGSAKFMQELGGVTVWQQDIGYEGTASAHRVNLDTSFGQWTVIHEFAHAWDGNHNWNLSAMLMEKTGGYISVGESRRNFLRGECDVVWNGRGFGEGNAPGTHGRKPGCNNVGYFYKDMPSGANWNFTPKEDFAESVVMYIGWSDPNLSSSAVARIKRYENTGLTTYFGVEEDWSTYAQYFYPQNRDYTTTTRWKFIDSLMNGKILIP